MSQRSQKIKLPNEAAFVLTHDDEDFAARGGDLRGAAAAGQANRGPMVVAVKPREQLDGGNVTLRRIRGDDKPIAGTQLVRQYQGSVHTVTVTVSGYAWEGRPYRSLSAIARAITGTRWNGWAFFGLKNRS